MTSLYVIERGCQVHSPVDLACGESPAKKFRWYDYWIWKEIWTIVIWSTLHISDFGFRAGFGLYKLLTTIILILSRGDIMILFSLRIFLYILHITMVAGEWRRGCWGHSLRPPHHVSHRRWRAVRKTITGGQMAQHHETRGRRLHLGSQHPGGSSCIGPFLLSFKNQGYHRHDCRGRFPRQQLDLQPPHQPGQCLGHCQVCQLQLYFQYFKVIYS